MSPMSSHPAIAITMGEPAGIGPELVGMIAERHARAHFPARLVVIGDRGLLEEPIEAVLILCGGSHRQPVQYVS